MAFEWDHVRSFLAVLQAGSLSKAALALGISQPSLGRHVRALEQQLGVQLFERRGQRLVPTTFARELAGAAAGMQRGALDVERMLAERTRAATHGVRISASRVVATYLLPELLARRAERGDLELVAEDQLSNLIDGEAELAVRLVKPTQQSLVARRVGTIRFGVYASRAYLRAQGTPGRASELAQHALIGFDRSPQLEKTARRLGVQLGKGASNLRSDDRMVHFAAVRAGLGIGVLPTYVAQRESGVVRVLPDEKVGSTGVWLVARRDVLERSHVRALFELLRAGLSELLGAAP
ncbi:MAG: LysR family transcriptional regulator [Polyangiales bacterium]